MKRFRISSERAASSGLLLWTITSYPLMVFIQVNLSGGATGCQLTDIPLKSLIPTMVTSELPMMDRKPECLPGPTKLIVDTLITDDHWVTDDRSYRKLAVREDNGDAISVQLQWGEGYYVAFAVDTRDPHRTMIAKPLVENALCYLANLAWQTSPRQPLKGRYRTHLSDEEIFR